MVGQCEALQWAGDLLSPTMTLNSIKQQQEWAPLTAYGWSSKLSSALLKWYIHFFFFSLCGIMKESKNDNFKEIVREELCLLMCLCPSFCASEIFQWLRAQRECFIFFFSSAISSSDLWRTPSFFYKSLAWRHINTNRPHKNKLNIRRRGIWIKYKW